MHIKGQRFNDFYLTSVEVMVSNFLCLGDACERYGQPCFIGHIILSTFVMIEIRYFAALLKCWLYFSNLVGGWHDNVRMLQPRVEEEYLFCIFTNIHGGSW